MVTSLLSSRNRGRRSSCKMGASSEELERGIQIFGSLAGGKRHPTGRDPSARCRSTNQVEERSKYRRPKDWVFASRHSHWEKPYWGQAILPKYLRPAAQKLGIEKRFGWHTFRHTYSTLLRSVGTEFKVCRSLSGTRPLDQRSMSTPKPLRPRSIVHKPQSCRLSFRLNEQ
jgi:integrase